MKDGGVKRERKKRVESSRNLAAGACRKGKGAEAIFRAIGTDLRGSPRLSREGLMETVRYRLGPYAWVCILDARYRCDRGTWQAHKHDVRSGVRGNGARDDL